MLNGIFDSSSLPLTQQMAQFAETRHELLVGNLANLDTPGYQAKDLSVEQFQSQLRQSLDARDLGPITPGVAYQQQPPVDQVSCSMEPIMLHDGSRVGLEQQVTEMSKNQFMHNLAISIMSSQFRLLQAAISERV